MLVCNFITHHFFFLVYCFIDHFMMLLIETFLLCEPLLVHLVSVSFPCLMFLDLLTYFDDVLKPMHRCLLSYISDRVLI